MDISVIIPVLNGATTIGEQLEALSAQRFGGEFEVIVVDNGSTDATTTVVRAHAAQDPRTRLVDGSHLPRSGGAARNTGAEQASAPLLAFCDADDVVQPGWLTAIHGALEHESVVTTALEYWSLNPHLLHLTHPQFLGEHLVCGVPGIPGGAFGIRRDVYVTVGGFDPNFSAAEDSELGVRLAVNGYRIVHLPHALVSVRLRSTPVAAFRRGRLLRGSVTRIRERHGLPQPGPLLVTKRALWCLRYLLVTAPCCISSRGRCTWMNRAGEARADLDEIVRRLRSR
ncbi:MAG: glycosyltransferase [Actinobacteria bacterium]|uniref:Unannotated protein n=1 Tax=freshwater metagenome TaxID=449393 RepID=A0A6J6TER3_9ZZZZ|nr:glycosyltransferase [Actinomycetota bacterium]MSY12599.1 glycosyltransferase [Actinomycetota bacterium]MSZ03501.1 glycosyltransferase [Actinomycetota bacterium]MTB06958.1 glycosyltransferase [Actinomycetota bacterium]